jgi:hypothetical protein
MTAARNVRRITFPIRALLVAMCVLVIPKLAASEPNTQQRDDARKQAKAPWTAGGAAPMRAWSRLFTDREGCARAKLDVWLGRGVATYSIFMADVGATGQLAAARIGGGAEGTTILFGEKDCRIRIRIEQAPADANIDN